MATTAGTRTIVGIFNTVHDAEASVRALEEHGFSRDEVSLVANRQVTASEAADKNSQVAADAGIGAAIGAVGGILLGAAALAIPGIGPILAAGPLAAALTGAGIGAAAGGLIGALTESGIPEDEAKQYAEGVRRGDVLVTVRATSEESAKVREIMDAHGALDVDSRVNNWRERGWTGHDANARPYNEDELRRERSYYESQVTETEHSPTSIRGWRARVYDPTVGKERS